MPTISAGILLYRKRNALAEVLLVHPGGPYWAGKDIGTWSVPKGVVERGEDEYACARREFREETGFDIAQHEKARNLGSFRQSSSKVLRVWAVEGDCDPVDVISNLFELEWPPHSGHMRRFPEIDRGGWFDRVAAGGRILKGQRPILEVFYGGRSGDAGAA